METWKELWAEPLSPKHCQTCVPTLCSADPHLEPFTKARTNGGGLLKKGYSPRSRHPPWSGAPFPNSPTGWPKSTVSLECGGQWEEKV